MVDYRELMALLSIPRPNGSAAERNTALALQKWLDRHNIPYQVQTFRLYPFFFECVGFWLILSRTILALSIWFHWGWWTFPIAVLATLGGTLDYAFNLPIVTWPGVCQGQNIIIQFNPDHPRQEIIFSAHYDTKTEFFDHTQRMFFLKYMKSGIILTLILGFIGPIDAFLDYSNWVSPTISNPTYWFGVALTLPMLFIAWGFGLHLSVGRLLKPSQGAVDNGAACAILLGLANQLVENPSHWSDTLVTLALFTGEEVNMQGSHAYVHKRSWLIPAFTVNLEVMAQDGDYIYWERDGNVFRLIPTTESLNQAFSKAVTQVTGRAAIQAGSVNSDGGSFLFAGIPATTIGTRDISLEDTGLHRPSDNIDRVVMGRLPEGVNVLEALIDNLKI